MSSWNFLVTGVASDLGQSIIKALKLSSLVTAIFGTDHEPLSFGAAFVDQYRRLPAHADDVDLYVTSMAQLCAEWDVHFLVPGSEAEAAVISKHWKVFADIGVRLLAHDSEVLDRWGDKLTAMRLLQGAVPLLGFADGDNPGEVAELSSACGFPLVVKPRRSHGGRGFRVVREELELRQCLEGSDGMIVQEFSDRGGGEFSIGVFSWDDFHEVIVLLREMDRFGTATSYAEVRIDREVEEFARRVASIAAVEGSLNVQLARDSRGRIGLFEINPRFSALVSARAMAGFRDVEWWARGLYGALERPGFTATPPLRIKRYLEDLVDQGGGFRPVAEWR